MTEPSSGSPQHAKDESILAELGYKQEFKRDFKLLEVFGLGFSIISVLPSLATVLVFSIPYGGPVVMIWGWFVCSIFLAFVAAAIAELGSAAPTAGGVYYWTFKYSSKRYRHFLCWLIGYLNTITYISGFTSVEWGCAVQIMAAISIGTDLRHIPTVYHIYGVFVALALLHASICLLATKVIARLQTLAIILNIALCVAVIIGLPASAPSELKNDATYVFKHFENLSTWSNGFAFLLSFLAPLWVVSGFDSTVHISEEARNANVAIPWAIVTSIVLSCNLGWVLNIVMAFTMGKDLPNIVQNPVGQPFATIVLAALGKRGTLALWTFVIIAQFMMGASILTASARQVFAFSRDGALPFSKYLYYISRSQGIPSRSVWVCVGAAILLGLIPLAGPAASSGIFALPVIGQYACNATAICARWFGPSGFRPGPFNLGIMSLPVSVVAVAFMVLMAIILCFPSEPDVTPDTMNYAALVFGAVVLLATFYYFCPGIGGRYWFKGPVVTVDWEEKEEPEEERVSQEK